MTAVKEITLDELLDDYDWAQVFADENAGNVSKDIQAIPGSTCSTAEVSRKDVKEIIAAVNGENDRAEWVGVFLLHDGRYLIAEGGCNYTGWDCLGGNSLLLADTLQAAISLGLNAEQQVRLGLSDYVINV